MRYSVHKFNVTRHPHLFCLFGLNGATLETSPPQARLYRKACGFFLTICSAQHWKEELVFSGGPRYPQPPPGSVWTSLSGRGDPTPLVQEGGGGNPPQTSDTIHLFKDPGGFLGWGKKFGLLSRNRTIAQK